MLSAFVQLRQRPPAAWLTAAAESCYHQLQHFGQQELVLMLWAFAKLRYRPCDQLLTAAASRVQQQQQLEGFTPQNTALLLYAFARLEWQRQDASLGSSMEQLQLSSGDDWQGLLEHTVQQQLQVESSTHDGSSSADGGSSRNGGGCSSSSSSADSVGQVVAALSSQAWSQLQQCNAQDLALLAWSLGRWRLLLQQQQPQPTLALLQSYLAAATRQLRKGAFSCQGVSTMVWGLGTLVHASQQQPMHTVGAPSREWVDLLACQCLDCREQLSGYQLVAAVQGLVWLQHPRGLNLLQAALPACCSSRLLNAAPQELLLLLRGCVHNRHTPELAAWANLLSAVRGQAQHMSAQQVAQVLYLLGKMQQQQRKRQKLVELRSAAAAATGGSGSWAVSPVSLSDSSSGGWRGDSWQQQQQQWQQHPCGLQHSYAVNGNSSSSSSSAGARQRSPVESQQQQLAKQPDSLVPAEAMCELVRCMAGRLEQCTPLQASLMVWGIAQLAPAGMHVQLQAASSTSSSSSSSMNGNSRSTPTSKAASGAGSSTAEAEPAAAEAGVMPFSDCPAGQQLLQELYDYSAARLQSFRPSELATLLYAVHKLGVVSPPAGWLAAVVQQAQAHLQDMNGQDLAALAAALAGFNWMPSASWLAAFVEAAVTAEQAGRFSTDWQRACLWNGLSALDPIAGQVWQQRVNAGSRGPAAAEARCSSVGHQIASRGSVGRPRSRSSNSNSSDTGGQVAAAFWAALEGQTVQQLAHFSGHELANLLWGVGCLVNSMKAHGSAVQNGREVHREQSLLHNAAMH